MMIYIQKMLWIIGVLVIHSQALNYNWTGGGMNDFWSNGDNWNQGGTIPGPGDDVFILGLTNSTMDQDFTINSLQVGGDFLGELFLQSNTLTVATDIHLHQNLKPINASSATLNFPNSNSVLNMIFNQTFGTINSLNGLELVNMNLGTNTLTLRVLDTLRISGDFQLNKIDLYADLKQFDNQGVINDLDTESNLFIAADSILNIGSLDINSVFYKIPQRIPGGAYLKDLTLTTQGFPDTAYFIFDSKKVEVQGDLKIEIDSIQKVPIVVSADSTEIDLKGDWISKSISDDNYDEIFIDLGSSVVNSQGNIHLSDLSVDNREIFESRGSLSHVGVNNSIGIENSSQTSNTLGSIILNNDISLFEGALNIKDSSSLVVLSDLEVLDLASIQMNLSLIHI